MAIEVLYRHSAGSGDAIASLKPDSGSHTDKYYQALVLADLLGEILGIEANPLRTKLAPDARAGEMARVTVTAASGDTNYTSQIPDWASHIILWTDEANGFIYAVDTATEDGADGAGLVLRQNIERVHVLEDGTSRVLNYQSPTGTAQMVIEYA
jgi:hypothetical protein